jgi:hypothetical protein
MNKIEKVMFNTAYKFYTKLGKSEQEASYRAWLDVKQKMGLSDDEWIDITTGEKVNIHELELS